MWYASEANLSVLAQSLISRFWRVGTFLVGVDGCGGAGKSTFAKSLSDVISSNGVGKQSCIVHMDDFYLPSTRRPHWSKEASIIANYDGPRLITQILAPLSDSRPANYQRYDWPTDALAEWRTIHPGQVVIVEGVSALSRSLRDFYDYKIWVESPRATCLTRGVARDGEVMRSWWEEDWMPAEDSYLTAERPHDCADLVVDGTR